MQNKKNFRWRMVLYALMLLVLYVLQTARGTRVHLWGATVDMLPFMLAAIALFEGPYVGAAFGFAAGLLTAVNSGAAEGLMALYYSVCCLGAGWFATRYMRRVYPTLLMCGVFISGLKSLFVFFFYYALVYQAHSFGALRYAGLTLAFSAVFSPLIYLIVKKIHLRFTEEE